MQTYIDKQGQQLNLDSADSCLYALHDKIANYDSSNGNTLLQCFNADNDAKGIFNLALTMQLPELVTRTRPDTDSDILIPTRYMDYRGFQELKTTYLESAGQVTRGKGDNDVNYMDIKYRQESTTFVTNKLGVYISRETMRSNMLILAGNYYQGLNLVRDIQTEAQNQFSEDYHLVKMFGELTHGVSGLFTHPDTPESIVTTFFPYSTSTTRAENYNWLLNIVKTALKGSRYYGKYNSLLIPHEYAIKLMEIDALTNVDVTAWDLLLTNFNGLGITNIAYLPELNEDSLVDRKLFDPGDNQALIYLYRRDPSCLESYCTTPEVIDKSPMDLDKKYIIEQMVSTLNYKKPLESLKVQFNTGEAP